MPKKNDNELHGVKTTIQKLKNSQDQSYDAKHYNSVSRNENKCKHVDIIFFVLCVMVLNCLAEVKAFLNDLNKPSARKNLRTNTLLAVQIACFKNVLGYKTKEEGRIVLSDTLTPVTITNFYTSFVKENIKCYLTDKKSEEISSKVVVDYITTLVKEINKPHIYVELCETIETLKLQHPLATNRNIVDMMFKQYCDMDITNSRYPANGYQILKVRPMCVTMLTIS